MQDAWGLLSTAQALHCCNGWTGPQTEAYIASVEAQRARRSEHGWSVDLQSVTAVLQQLCPGSAAQAVASHDGGGSSARGPARGRNNAAGKPAGNTARRPGIRMKRVARKSAGPYPRSS